MCNKIFVILLAFIAVLAVCWCFVFDVAVTADDLEIAVSLTSNRNIGSMTDILYEDTSTSEFHSWYSPMVSAWGSPVGYLNFDMNDSSTFAWEFTFAPSSTYTYVIMPRYVVSYGLGNTNNTVVFTHATPAIGAGDFELVDTRTLENISDGLTTVDYSWDLYRARYTGTATTFVMTLSGPGLGSYDGGTWSFPVFSPRAFKSGGSGSVSSEGSGGSVSSEESGGTGTGTGTGGENGDCQQWNDLNDRLNNIESFLNGIGWDLNELKDKLFDDTYKDWEVSAAQSKYDEAQSDVNSIIDAMSIPALDYIPNKPNIPGSGSGDGTIGTFMDFVGGLWWISIPLVTACGCWVASLILYGKHNVK